MIPEDMNRLTKRLTFDEVNEFLRGAGAAEWGFTPNMVMEKLAKTFYNHDPLVRSIVVTGRMCHWPNEKILAAMVLYLCVHSRNQQEAMEELIMRMPMSPFTVDAERMGLEPIKKLMQVNKEMERGISEHGRIQSSPF